jgi:hypothetical protein
MLVGWPHVQQGTATLAPTALLAAVRVISGQA